MTPAHARLAALYRDLDAALAALGPSCRGCGECCCFDRVDHVLYASDLERNYLLAVAPPPADPALADLVTAGRRCPYQIGTVCAAREGRVLGCRLHFCEGLGGAGEQETGEGWHQRVKKLHDDLGLPWRYAPLLPLVPGEFPAEKY